MSDQDDLQFGTYRCPVCGHRDSAEIDPDGGGKVIKCSYCNTALEVSSRGIDSVRFSVQVAKERTL